VPLSGYINSLSHLEADGPVFGIARKASHALFRSKDLNTLFMLELSTGFSERQKLDMPG